eukprot:CAMPEP_0114563074 /NCGR_PEP_ID=MMETSP0114-20121206/12891_1 /TAXON_ID=31324 /ORGANISM="Goniomonas sp, Strain m" /LENGTH=504 /DNA_ID=CAMNT_0001748847 /DNA_START=8 /DNA_END=1522 /DNA_ORIENTATION=-
MEQTAQVFTECYKREIETSLLEAGTPTGAASWFVKRFFESDLLDPCQDSPRSVSSSTASLETVSSLATDLYRDRKVRGLRALKLCFSLAMVMTEHKAAICALKKADKAIKPELSLLQSYFDRLEELDDAEARCPEAELPHLRKLVEEQEELLAPQEAKTQQLGVAKDAIQLQIAAIEERMIRVNRELCQEPILSSPLTPLPVEKEYLMLREKLIRREQELKEAQDKFEPALRLAMDTLGKLEETEDRLAAVEEKLKTHQTPPPEQWDRDPAIHELRAQVETLDQILELKRYEASEAEAGIEVARSESRCLQRKVLELESKLQTIAPSRIARRSRRTLLTTNPNKMVTFETGPLLTSSGSPPPLPPLPVKSPVRNSVTDFEPAATSATLYGESPRDQSLWAAGVHPGVGVGLSSGLSTPLLGTAGLMCGPGCTSLSCSALGCSTVQIVGASVLEKKHLERRGRSPGSDPRRSERSNGERSRSGSRSKDPKEKKERRSSRSRSRDR